MQGMGSEEYLTLREWSRIAFKRWKVIVAVFLLVFSGYFGYSVYTFGQKLKSHTPLYAATVRIMFGPETLEAMTSEGQMMRRTYSPTSEIVLLESNLVAEQTAAVLIEDYGYKEPKERLTKQVKNSVKIDLSRSKSGGTTNTLEISATSNSPQRAFDMTNAMIEGYQRQKRKDENKFFRDTYRTFSEQLDVARGNLHKAETTLTDFIMENEDIAETVKSYGLVGETVEKVLAAGVGINEKYLQLKSQVSTEEEFIESIETLAKKDKLAALSLIAKRRSHLADLDLKKMLLEKEEELNSLLLINEEAHPAVIQARGELRSIENKIDKSIESAIESIMLDLNILKSQEEKLSRLIETDVHKKIIAYNTLQRDIVLKRNIYSKLAEELQRLNLGERLKRYTEVRVLEPAVVPRWPSNPLKLNLIQLILSSLGIAALSSIAFTYLMEMLDTSVRDVEQLERIIELPVLVMIPWYRSHKHKKGHHEKQPEHA